MIISEILCLLETWPKEIRENVTDCCQWIIFSHFLMPGKAVLAVGKQIMGYAVFKLFVSEILEIAICTYNYVQCVCWKLAAMKTISLVKRKYLITWYLFSCPYIGDSGSFQDYNLLLFTHTKHFVSHEHKMKNKLLPQEMYLTVVSGSSTALQESRAVVTSHFQ